ncbi:hypothetical protein Q4F19_17315 [Sphingomonas sp. BIUV-7]|uniref:Uncharacterized protein n=1 Tax=Sphingomonas natans TaxID=3063330 RepID=A0ABT8YCU6_9SPHN|nr:hypothetical protein [Sphingomonas sp. BIUV-7]MDO6416149.1 hypothetical protein [Sphingomonas sp. BIUV-7]
MKEQITDVLNSARSMSAREWRDVIVQTALIAGITYCIGRLLQA